MKNKRGFTLIELLAVIIILGILMVIAIPSVTSYISYTRNKAYLISIKQYANACKNRLNANAWGFYDEDTTYYIHINNLPLETRQTTPYGDFKDAYVLVTFDEGKGWTYYWTSVDESSHIVNTKKVDDLVESDVKVDKMKTSINNREPIGTRNRIVIVDKDGNVSSTSQRIEVTKEEADKCYKYQELTDGTIDITYYDINCGKDLTIPSVIDGKEITKIHAYAFYNMGITGVIIPDTVKTIGERAFMNSTLEQVTLPEGLQTIGDRSFQNCQLIGIDIPSTVTSIEAHAFYNNKISTVKIPSKAKIAACSFCLNPLPNPSFLYVEKSDGTMDYSQVRGYIGDLTEFSDNKFVIPGEVNGVKLTTIKSSAFASMPFSGWEVVIPDSVKTIESGAFNASSIAKVNLPEGLLTIGDNAFYNNKLTSIKIPSTVTKIGIYAFNLNQTTNEDEMWIYNRTDSGILEKWFIN